MVQCSQCRRAHVGCRTASNERRQEATGVLRLRARTTRKYGAIGAVRGGKRTARRTEDRYALHARYTVGKQKRAEARQNIVRTRCNAEAEA